MTLKEYKKKVAELPDCWDDYPVISSADDEGNYFQFASGDIEVVGFNCDEEWGRLDVGSPAERKFHDLAVCLWP